MNNSGEFNEKINKKTYRVLVDMDGVLAFFDKKLVEIWKQKWPNDDVDKILNRDTFEIDGIENFANDAREKVDEIYLSKGFFESLEPMANNLGRLALNEMASMGHEVYILTSAGSRAMHAPSEKFFWIRNYLGPEWVSKIIVSKDKNVVHGDFLIDDKPEPNGEENTHSWEHIIYDRPYNRHVIGKRRITWENWKENLPELTN